MLLFEETTCDWCGTREGEVLFEGPDLLMNLPGQFRMLRCSKCGLFRQDPRLTWESLETYYPQHYSAYETIISTETSVLKRLDRRYGMWKRLQVIRKFQPGGKLLEAGCGTGIFLAEAKRSRRWDLTALEPNQAAAGYIERTLQMPVITERFANANLPANHFDVITMWNVLEHLDHPITDLRRAHQLLKEGGWFVFSIPNLESLEAKAFGRYWLGWDLPRHLYLFPQKQLRRILEEIGFKWVEARCIAGGHASMELSFEFLLRAKNANNTANRFLLKLFRSLPVRIAFSPLFWLLGQFRQSSLITIIVQKKTDGAAHD